MTAFSVSTAARAALCTALGAMTLAPAAAQAQTYAQVIGNDTTKCRGGAGPAIRVTIENVRSSEGQMFVRTYFAKGSDWLKSKRYLTRVDLRPSPGTMVVCVPVESAGEYAVAVHHDINGNREVDRSTDGGGMTNNPGWRMLGLLPPTASQARIGVGNGVKETRIVMRYPD